MDKQFYAYAAKYIWVIVMADEDPSFASYFPTWQRLRLQPLELL